MDLQLFLTKFFRRRNRFAENKWSKPRWIINYGFEDTFWDLATFKDLEMQHEPLVDEMSSSLKEWQSIKRKSFVDLDPNSIFFYSDKKILSILKKIHVCAAQGSLISERISISEMYLEGGGGSRINVGIRSLIFTNYRNVMSWGLMDFKRPPWVH